MDTSKKTVNDILDRYQADCFHRLAARTKHDYEYYLPILRRHFGAWIAEDLKPRDFAEFMNVPKGKIHRNRLIAVLSASFTHAVRKLYWLDRNVIRDVARNDSEPRDRCVTDEEYKSFYATTNKRVQIAMDLALLTGQRQGDLLSLRWDQVQPIGLVIQQSKTRKRLAIQITPELQAVLDRARSLSEYSEYVICTRKHTRYTSAGFRAVWQRFMRRWKDKGNQSFTFHDLRAKSATDSATVEDAYYRLGHTSIAMTRRVYDRGIRKVQPLR